MKGIMIFLAGVAVGGAVSWFVSKKVTTNRLLERTEAEIQSVKDAFKQIEEEEKQKAIEKSKNPNEAISEYKGEPTQPLQTVQNANSDSEKKADKAELENLQNKANKKHLEPKEGEPYCISMDEYGEEGNELENLTYYSDGVLAYDDTGEVIRHIDEVVGRENLYHFGEFEEDMLYVRDPVECIDYAIALSDKPYRDKG